MPAIVVGVDFSEQARRAVQAATRLAQDMGASLVLVHAYPKGPPGTAKQGRVDPITQLQRETSLEEATEVGQAWAAEARADDVEAEVVCEEGPAADAVLRVAKQRGAVMVVVGTHGRTGLQRAVLGSVADAIVRGAKVPVLVVP